VLELQTQLVELDNELMSYENMETSNHLIKEINEQIMGEVIRVGEYWKAAQEKIGKNSWSDPMENPDI
jgi:hypothetical protein